LSSIVCFLATFFFFFFPITLLLDSSSYGIVSWFLCELSDFYSTGASSTIRGVARSLPAASSLRYVVNDY
jgi:hypothetical protein